MKQLCRNLIINDPNNQLKDGAISRYGYVYEDDSIVLYLDQLDELEGEAICDEDMSEPDSDGTVYIAKFDLWIHPRWLTNGVQLELPLE